MTTPAERRVTICVLILVGGLVLAGQRSLQAGRETSAVQSAQSFSADATTWQRSYGGFPALAANLATPTGTNATNSCTADGEIPATIASKYDSPGLIQGGYTFLYVSSGTFSGSACGNGSTTPASVATTYDFTANPIDLSTKSACSDQSGVYYLPPPTPMVNSGKGCIADNPTALAIGQ